MTDTPTIYNARFYLKNPGGAYDPAHMGEFDIEGSTVLPGVVIGDTICSTTRLSTSTDYETHYYKVVDRTIRFDPNDIFVFYLIEEVPENWVGQFN
ncbi:hypothetical protein [Ruixingdingia sedimenti]|uniref:Uncharacterized protein n=1 Tax=Ruixingdingia sedimenti TaxID=3073604 RepID=A0ABU1F294_9RHOB|nr:hypothetical protein [Xinfangfangia sp. LG-4]MDR5650986.1 hypothetical protein [Xinfangfangia sp. LG-4]